MAQDPRIGDIVLYQQEHGDMNPAIIVKFMSPTSAILGHFVVGGMVGSWQPAERGDQPGQWQIRAAQEDQEK